MKSETLKNNGKNIRVFGNLIRNVILYVAGKKKKGDQVIATKLDVINTDTLCIFSEIQQSSFSSFTVKICTH